KEEFVSAFIERAKKLKIGNGMDEGVELGPLSTAKRLEEIEKLVETTKKGGSKSFNGWKKTFWF
ncbi:aldehyde dehydrogenase family protein, partial [Candidatus Pelagibacter sp.]|nr:aldehyde dehydrogenase family protein [Candidatus Pelagibacter sp.]